jgi:hypothetical protein
MRPSSKPKPPTNPTTTKATIHQYTAIALVVLIHLLNDHPRHIRHREELRKNTRLNKERSETVDTRTRSWQYRSYSPPSPVPHKHRNKTTSPNGERRTRRRTSPPPTRCSAPQDTYPSMTQKAQAWTRMRSVTPSTSSFSLT